MEVVMDILQLLLLLAAVAIVTLGLLWGGKKLAGATQWPPLVGLANDIATPVAVAGR